MSVSEFLDRLERVRRSNGGWTARCPAHEDRAPSLSIREGDDGRILVHCHTGCPPAKVCAALGLHLVDLFPGPPIDWEQFRPRTREERRAAELQRLRRHFRNLELDRQRAMVALHRACLLIGIAYSDDPEAVLERLWQGAVDELERRAAEAADAYCLEENHV